ncbi:MAG: hypothetical protein B7Z52_04015, partial [Burkholderiales bacterium 12-64-5]
MAIADPLAVIVLALQAELAEDGLKHNVDYRTINAGTHINAMLQALNGRADAAMVGQSPYILSPPELRKQLHILLETPPLSSLTYLTHPRLSEAEALTIRETLLRGATANRFPEGALEFFRYHSPSYWCDPEAPGAQTFLQSEVTPGLAQKTPDPVDILFTQGFRDTLFNFNDAFHNFSCYRALEDDKGKKADVRLLTHQSGHILPLSPSMVPGLADLTEQGAQNGLNEIEFQKPGGPFACGALSIPEAQFAFLVEKLFTPQEAAAIKNASESNAFTTLAANKGKVCLSLNDDIGQGSASENAALWVNENTFFSNLGPQAKGQATNSNIQPVAIDFTPGADPLNVLTSAVTGILRYPFAPAVMPIELPAGVNVVAGIPTATFEIAPPVDMLMNPLCSEIYAATAMSPIGLAGLEPGCDPMLFVGLGVNRNGAWRLIDDQVTPVRGFGK